MAVSEQVKKFSNDIYATEKDVVEITKSSLIQGIWRQIIEYRSEFSNTISLKHFDGTAFVVCSTPAISSKISNIERKLNSATLNFMRLKRATTEEYFEKNALKDILRVVAKRYKIQPEERILNLIVSGNAQYIDPQYLVLVHYYNCLQKIVATPLEEITEDTIGVFYQEMCGEQELTEYYRTDEGKKRDIDLFNGQLFVGVPSRYIESSVEALIEFIAYSDLPLFAKAVCAFYYLYYIKPFDVYSEEIALLLFKKILATNDVEDFAAYINFEEVLYDKDLLEKKMHACQKYFDLTYLVDFFLQKADSILNLAQELMDKSNEHEVRKDLYQEEEKEVMTDTKIEEAEEENPLFANLPQEEKLPPIEPAPREKEVIKEEAPIQQTQPVQTVQQVQQTFNPNQEMMQTAGLAIGNVPAGLSEEDASILEARLLEMNPILSKGQAYFYARHCTIGMCYTVDQYKKATGCAYETARTSMNDLCELGYYEKKDLKKKFVYIPIKRK